MAIFVLELFLFLFFVMGKEGGKRKREGEEGKRKSKRGEKEKEEKGKEQKKEEEVDDVIEEKKMEEKGREERNFQCGICLELMCWEKKPKILPSCLHSFCSVCLNKLFQSQSSSNTSSPSSSSSSSSSSLSPQSNGVVSCPVCRKVNQCDGVETLEMNYLIPETIDSLVSSKVISLSQQSSGFFFSSITISRGQRKTQNTQRIRTKWNAEILRCVKIELKCTVGLVKCSFVIHVILLILQISLLETTFVKNNNKPNRAARDWSWKE